MDSRFSPLVLLLFLSLTSLLLICDSTSSGDLKTYIVYTGNAKTDAASKLSLYKSMIQQVAGSNSVPKKVLYHYKRSFNGFVVKLTEQEAERMAGLDGVVSVFPDKKKKLHTTRSWDFIGFPLKVNRAKTEGDVIIGVIDSGIWPKSESFSDERLGPPPRKWNGTCRATNFTCNNKIIGAKYYRADREFSPEDVKSPRDTDGHGSHVASIAAGKPVNRASMLGLGLGTARGIVPSARLVSQVGLVHQLIKQISSVLDETWQINQA